MRRPTTVLTAALMCVAATSFGAPSAQAAYPPALVGFVYLNGPYAWAGQANHPVAEVVLDQAAPSDTTVALASDDPSVATPASVTVPAGSDSAVVTVSTISAGTATLTATLGVTSVSATPDLEVRTLGAPTALSDLEVQPTSVPPSETATATILLDFLAPPGGSTVTITSSDPELSLPAAVVVPADQHQATFDVPVPVGYSADIVLTATLGEESRQATLLVVDPDPDDDGVAGEADRCPEIAGTTADGCPKVGAEVTLTYRAAAEKFRGIVTAGSGCGTARKMTLYRVRTGADARVDTATTNDEGSYVIARDARAGRYYAKAAPKDVESARCLASTSPTIRVR